VILAQAVGTAIKVDLRVLLDRAFVAAKNSGVGYNVAAIPPSFNAPTRGPFDPDYMRALYQAGYDQGKGAGAFSAVPPPYPGPATPDPGDNGKSGATK
jgi:hypothetical protein